MNEAKPGMLQCRLHRPQILTQKPVLGVVVSKRRVPMKPKPVNERLKIVVPARPKASVDVGSAAMAQPEVRESLATHIPEQSHIASGGTSTMRAPSVVVTTAAPVHPPPSHLVVGAATGDVVQADVALGATKGDVAHAFLVDAIRSAASAQANVGDGTHGANSARPAVVGDAAGERSLDLPANVGVPLSAQVKAMTDVGTNPTATVATSGILSARQETSELLVPGASGTLMIVEFVQNLTA